MKLFSTLLACSVLLGASTLSYAADETAPMAGQMQQKMQQHLKETDTNGDGNISKQEFMAGCEKRFQKMDANGDGQITKEERQQMRMQHKGQMGGQTGTP